MHCAPPPTLAGRHETPPLAAEASTLVHSNDHDRSATGGAVAFSLPNRPRRRRVGSRSRPRSPTPGPARLRCRARPMRMPGTPDLTPPASRLSSGDMVSRPLPSWSRINSACWYRWESGERNGTPRVAQAASCCGCTNMSNAICRMGSDLWRDSSPRNACSMSLSAARTTRSRRVIPVPRLQAGCRGPRRRAKLAGEDVRSRRRCRSHPHRRARSIALVPYSPR